MTPTTEAGRALLDGVRWMPDGTPCWCVSRDEPHESWVHAPLCVLPRQAYAAGQAEAAAPHLARIEALTAEVEGWRRDMAALRAQHDETLTNVTIGAESAHARVAALERALALIVSLLPEHDHEPMGWRAARDVAREALAGAAASEPRCAFTDGERSDGSPRICGGLLRDVRHQHGDDCEPRHLPTITCHLFLPAASEGAGEPRCVGFHDFGRMTCRRCGTVGNINLSIVGEDERLDITKQPVPVPSDTGRSVAPSGDDVTLGSEP